MRRAIKKDSTNRTCSIGRRLNSLAPAEPGDGWDKTALTMRSKLQAEKSSGSVQVLNAPGAGGTIELAQFVNQNKDDPSQLIVGGLVMVGATSTNNPPVNLDAIMPFALLSGEYESIVLHHLPTFRTLVIWLQS